MGAALAFFLPLATFGAAVDAPVAPEQGSSRFAEVLVTSYVCEHLGYSVDYAGLADWGDALRDQLVATGLDEGAALGHIRNDVSRLRERFNQIHGQGIWTAASPALGIELGNDAQYRLQKTFTDRCNALVASADAGSYFAQPERRLTGAEFNRKTRAALVAARGGV